MKKQFKELQNKYPNLSSLICYIKLMKNKSAFEKRKWFKLVDRDDWEGIKREEIVNSIIAIN